MSIDSITSLDDIRADIVNKLRSALKMDPDAPLSEAGNNKSLEELRQQILAKAREQLGGSISVPGKPAGDFTVDVDDMRTRMLFYRIKNANISRGQRDALSGFVRSMAIDKKIGKEIVKSVSEMIFFMETTAGINRRNELKTFPLEKTVDNEMNSIYSMRARRDAMKENLENLRKNISPSD